MNYHKSSVASSRRRLTPRGGRRGRPRFAFETLEARFALALHIENFSDDLDPTQPGFDSWDADPLTIPGGDTDADPNTTLGPDEFLIPHQTSTGQVFLIFREDPGVASFALAVSGAADWYETNFYANRNLPGGLGQDEVAAVGMEVHGAGTILFVGENGVKTVSVRNWSGWDHVTVTSNDPSDSGAEMGPIERVLVTVDATSVPRGMVVDNITVLVLDSGFSNNPPEAAPDFATTLPGQPVDIDFMANDGDVDGDPISFVAFRKLPTSGLITVTTHPATNRPIATYTPAAGFHGVDSFGYEITDRRGTPPGMATGTVRVTVNTPPPARNRFITVPHGSTGEYKIVAPGLLDGLVDADNDPLAIRLTRLPGHATLATAPDGSAVYTPTTPDRRIVSDSFGYVVNDGFTDSDPMLASIEVPNWPPAAADGLIVASHGAPAPLHGSFSVFDADGDALIATIVEPPDHGVATLQVIRGKLEVEYEPAYPGGRVIGPDDFTYRLFDGYRESELATVEIRVNNNPPFAIADHLYLPRGPFSADPTATVFNTVYGHQPSAFESDRRYDLLTRFYRESLPLDVGNDENSYAPSGGDIVSRIDDFDLDVNRSTAGDQLRFEFHLPQFGTLLSADPVKGQFVYRPPPLLPQINVLTGEILTDRIDEDNDGDVTEQAPWLPVGYDWFEYDVSDGYSTSRAVVLIDVREDSAGILPQATDEAYEVFAGKSLSVPASSGLLANQFNEPIHIVDGPRHGTLELPDGSGAFVYRANRDFVGVDSALYLSEQTTWIDADGQVKHVQVFPAIVSFIVRNAPPEPLPDHYEISADEILAVDTPRGVLTNDHDFNGHALRVDFFTEPSHGVLLAWSEAGGFHYQPDPGFAGSDSFQYQVSDGFGTSVGTVTITVLANHRPRLASGLDFTDVDNVPVPFTPQALTGELLWTDSDGDVVTPLIVPGQGPQHGRAALRIVGDRVRLEYYPHNDHFAPYDEFQVAVTDGLAQSLPAMIRVTREDNIAPMAQDDFFVIQNRPVGAADTEPVLFAFPGVTWNDQDPDDDFLIVTLVSNPAHGALMLEDDGRFIYRPQRDFVGMDTFVYRVDDGSGITSQATVTMRILDERVPTAFDDSLLREWDGNVIPSNISPEDYTHRVYGAYVADNDVQPADWHVGNPPSADWALRLIPRPRQLAGNEQLLIHEGRVRHVEHLGWIGFQPWTRDINGDAHITFITGEVEATYAFADLNHPGYLSNFARFRVSVAPPALGSHTIFQVDENHAWFPLPPIDVQSSPGTLLEHARLVDPPAPVHLAGFEVFHDVAMELTISGMGPSGAATVTLTYAESLPAGTKYMKYGRRDDDPLTPADESQAQWYDFSFDPITGTGAQIVGDQIILHFVDGLRGDESRLANGVIVDPGAPVIPIDFIQGTDGDDDIHVVRAGDELAIYINLAPTGDPTYRVPLDRITALTILGGEGDDVLTVDCGQHPALGLDRLIFNGGAGNSALTLANGSARIDSTAPGGMLNTTVQAGAQLSTIRLNQNALTLETGSRVTLLPDAETSLITSLSLATGATLDIGTGALVLDYTGDSLLAEIREKILSGRGGPGFGASWNGTGITSSTAAQANAGEPEAWSVGYAENGALPLGAYTNFRGVAVDETAVLIAFTRTGDANLDGVVDDADVTIVSANYAPGVPNANWAMGDFDYNGFVDDGDVTLLGVFYEAGVAPPAAAKYEGRITKDEGEALESGGVGE